MQGGIEKAVNGNFRHIRRREAALQATDGGSPHRPFRDLAVVGAKLMVLFAIVLFALFWAGSNMMRLLPFSWERGIAEAIPSELFGSRTGPKAAALQEIADRLASQMNLPDGMTIRAHYNPGPTVNAFATIGGVIVIYEGLIRILPDENALAMVVAHEIAHVRHRDVAASLGGRLLLALVTGGADGIGGAVMSNAGTLTALSYSRGAERKADRAAIEALVATYGHAGGATDLFAALLAREHPGSPGGDTVDLLQTHPDLDDRIDRLEDMIEDRSWIADDIRRPMPAALR